MASKGNRQHLFCPPPRRQRPSPLALSIPREARREHRHGVVVALSQQAQKAFSIHRTVRMLCSNTCTRTGYVLLYFYFAAATHQGYQYYPRDADALILSSHLACSFTSLLW